MAIPVIMPRQGQSVESCIITSWHKKKGDRVKAGELLFSYETDKASFDEEAKADGILLEIFFQEGDDVPVLTNVCVIGAEGENIDQYREGKNEEPAAGHPVSAESDNPENKMPSDQKSDIWDEAQAISAQASTPFISGEKVKISPRAKNLAQRSGVDYRYANPTGPEGRIIEKDIVELLKTGPVVTPSAREEALSMNGVRDIAGTGIGGRITTSDLKNAAAGKQPAAPSLAELQKGQPQAAVSQTASQYEEVKVSNIRKVIAKAMHHSLASTAQLTLHASFDATDILEFRKRIKENKERLGLSNITLNDIVLYAVSRTLPQHKELNAHFLDDRMLLFNNVQLGVAVDTERGLMVPTLFDANTKSLNEISIETKKLAEECQKGSINPDSLKGGSFTVTNLGALDVEAFTPVLNPPQTGILGVSTITQRVKETAGGYVYYPAMGLSLTFDHRAVDGAPAARFLKDLKNNLENFSLLLCK